MKCFEEGPGALVLSRRDGAVDRQGTDHALDAIALAIHSPVPADFGLVIGFGRNAGTGAGLMRAGAEDWRLTPSQDRKQPDEVRTR